MRNFLYFQKWNAVARMCYKCLVVGDNNNLLKHSRFDRLAFWKNTKQTHEKYIAKFNDPTKILLFKICCGFRLEMFMIDILHCADLRIACHIVGNIILIVCLMHALASNIPDSIKIIDELLTQWQTNEKDSQ